MKTTFHLTDFTVEIPLPCNRNNLICVSILPDGKFNLNNKLANLLAGHMVRIVFTPDGEHLAIVEEEGTNTIRIPKNGSVKLPAIVDLLHRNKIILPAKYEVQFREKENFWQGDLLPNPTSKLSEKPRSTNRV